MAVNLCVLNGIITGLGQPSDSFRHGWKKFAFGEHISVASTHAIRLISYQDILEISNEYSVIQKFLSGT
ncbi:MULTISPECIES: hypothetical protein [Photorhabdus]|uniref:Uncharacterized protein n=1 Tax=Photorhabdus asymbiotica TaxID=291112 RepID=A0ABX9SI55_9GAMM|nr:hypothetical protein [Photorhabdus asymbiotica]RKS56782.1 hypothetical protein BDD30_3409 [Photorhabdus asymbiotica]